MEAGFEYYRHLWLLYEVFLFTIICIETNLKILFFLRKSKSIFIYAIQVGDTYHMHMSPKSKF